MQRVGRSSVAIAIALGIALIASLGAGGGTRALVSSINLSGNDWYSSIADVDGRLILSGRRAGSLVVSGSVLYSKSPARCHAAIVEPATLKLTHRTAGDCENPALYGRRVLPVNQERGPGVVTTVRIAHVVPGSPGFELGPVVMTYSTYSDTAAEWTYGDGSLWLYDVATTHGSELLRISDTTGRVLQRIAMPSLSRPIIAADADGLWMVPGVTSGWTGHPALGLYHVGVSARAPTLAFTSKANAEWMVASGHSVWIDFNHYPKQSTLWRFTGLDATPAFHTSAISLLNQTMANGSSAIAGNEADGLWTISPISSPPGGEAIRFQPDSGRWARIASVGVSGRWQAATLNGALFVLNPPATLLPAGRAVGFSALYRVTPPASG